MTFEQFRLALSEQGLSINTEQLQLLETFIDFVLEVNHTMNLTGHKTKALLLEKGVYDSLLFALKFPENALVLDLGSGGGFPGIPLKIMAPHIHITLMEPIQKKAQFLKAVIQKLNLKNIDVVTTRAEIYALTHREYFDFITSRAVASLPLLLELAIPLLKVNGVFFAFKGKDAYEEIRLSQNALTVLNSSVQEVIKRQLYHDHEERYLLKLIKEKKTDKKYPRMFSQMKQTPL
jgi:16S rRNA (guanine527-N7)-methyltransferase